jgi:fatty-acyl-CoA synthase
MTTVAELLLDRADDDRPALLFGDQAWSYRQLAEEGRRRAGLFTELHDPDRPPHIGVLLDNVPDYVFWLAAAALSTRRCRSSTPARCSPAGRRR